MIIVGIGSLAKEVLSFLKYELREDNVVFFLEPKFSKSELFLEKYKIINSYPEIENHIKYIENEFIVAIQHSRTRERIVDKLESFGGEYISLISKNSYVSHLNVSFRQVFIQPMTVIAHNVSLGKGCIIEPCVKLGHEIIIEDYVFVGPDVAIAGPCKIGKYSNIGAKSFILSDLNIGRNAVIGAGSVVFRDVKDNEVFVNNRNL